MSTKNKHIIEHSSSEIIILEAAPKKLPARVNEELLRRADAKPLFLDLRIGRVGAESQNLTASGKPRRYDKAAWQSVVKAINERSIIGQLGHPDLRADNGFNAAVAVYWLEAALKNTGDVTATAYIPPGPARDFVLTSKALGMSVATSLYAIGVESDDGSIVDLELQQLDFVLRPGLTAAMNGSHEYQIQMESVMQEKLHQSQQDFRALVETLRNHPDFKEALYAKATPQAIIEAVQGVVSPSGQKQIAERRLREVNTVLNQPGNRLDGVPFAVPLSEERVAMLRERNSLQASLDSDTTGGAIIPC
jgi:hypothetical protein